MGKRWCPKCGENRWFDPGKKEMVCACDGPRSDDPVGEEMDRRKQEARRLRAKQEKAVLLPSEVELAKQAEERRNWYD